MKKLLSLLSVLTISGTAVPTTIAASPYQKEKQENKLENFNFNRVKRQHQTDISTYVTQTNLGTIRQGANGISDLQILNAFVRANPNLPTELRLTNQRDRIIHVVANYGDRAIIDARGALYTGTVQVIFNGGQIPSEENYSFGLNSNWSSRLNLSTQNLNINLNILNQRPNERNIIQAFMFNNQNLPLELSNILRVSNIRNGGARIYVPEGNFRYYGSVQVEINEGRNYIFPQEISW
ncbi:hypothetical protein [Spiroplasma endosymbiont of Megaselia nigra]|uniref:hypothetical protein n=1 Tax=Spiroplasma endosymbiont of Megaselia nigra TaxID=2478537 RepID=UPI000F87B663|nr:hypothetical protein [Spiroplasma endosymbiont of Megaselia nigra]RUO86161.1 hypothetical protein D9R21_04730 [Spiroplasma endosymbiont of Megaselia nigra]